MKLLLFACLLQYTYAASNIAAKDCFTDYTHFMADKDNTVTLKTAGATKAAAMGANLCGAGKWVDDFDGVTAASAGETVSKWIGVCCAAGKVANDCANTTHPGPYTPVKVDADGVPPVCVTNTKVCAANKWIKGAPPSKGVDTDIQDFEDGTNCSASQWLDKSTEKCGTTDGTVGGTTTAGKDRTCKDLSICGTCSVKTADAGSASAAEKKLCTDKNNTKKATCNGVDYKGGSSNACEWVELGTCAVKTADAGSASVAEKKLCTDKKDKGKTACTGVDYKGGSSNPCVWTMPGTKPKKDATDGVADDATVKDATMISDHVCSGSSSSSSSSGLGAGAIAGIVIGVVVAIAIVIVVIWWCKRDNSQQ